MDPITILAALAPILVEGGKAAISRWIAPKDFKPATIEQWGTMQATQLQWFQAVTSAGGSNPSYPWVESVVRMMRPGVAIVVMITWAGVHAYESFGTLEIDTASVDNFASAIGFYLFGDRTLFYTNSAIRKAQ